MNLASPSTEQRPPSSPPAARGGPAPTASEMMMRAYVGYLAGLFDIGQLAVGRRLERSGVHEPLLND